MLTLFTDSDCDITMYDAKRMGYKLIPMPYSIEGETVYPYEDNDEFDFKAFYTRLRNGDMPTTFALNEQNYLNIFEPEFAAGNDIFYVHFSAAMTVTFDVMHRVVDKLKAKYPGRKFYEIDTLGITLPSYAIADQVSILFKQGKTPEEVLKWAETEVQRWAVYFFADNLKFFRRSGRVSGLAATMGGLIGLRPIIYMNEEGKMVSIGTEKGRLKAMTRLIDTIAEIGDLQDYPIYLGHADAPELAAQLADMIRSRFGSEIEIITVQVNPTTGAHCGPDTTGVCFHAKHR